MVPMSKRKRPGGADPGGEGQPKKPNRTGVQWNVWVDRNLDERVRKHIDATRPPITLTGLIETAVQEYMDRIQQSN